MKTLETRLEECKTIREQLQERGIYTIPECRLKLTKHMNEYIRTGSSQDFRLHSGEKDHVFRVLLTSREGKQCGIIHERP